tara:strand:- start:3901 stop:6606 length:2706 start_codon:yes stop_codon:yes gene_type:complete
MANNTSFLVGTYSITSGTVNPGDIIYAYLQGQNEYVASSVGPQSLTFDGDSWEDTSGGQNCYQNSCASGEFIIKFDYDESWEGRTIKFVVDSVNHGILPQVGVGVNSSPNQIACNNFFACDSPQTPSITFTIPEPTHTLNMSNSSTIDMNDNQTQDLTWGYSGVDDGYGNDDLYWSDGGQTTGVYVSNHTWTIKKNGSNVTESSYSDLTNNTSIQSDLTINFQPDLIVSNIESDQYTVKLKSRVTSLNTYNDGYWHESEKQYTINVANNDYITPLTDVCCNPTATDYICLNTNQGGNTDYCTAGCDFGGCTDGLYTSDPLILTCTTDEVNDCNFVPGTPDLNVTYTPGNTVVIIGGGTSTDPNGTGDLRYFNYEIKNEAGATEATYQKSNAGNFTHTFGSAGSKTISLYTEDYAGWTSETVTTDVTITVCGCTDSSGFASNYNPLANLESGTCQYTGCIYPDADNWICISNPDIWPCAENPPAVDGTCSSLNGMSYYADNHEDYWESFVYHIDDDDSCTFPPDYVDPGYTTVITNYIEAGDDNSQTNFEVIHGESTYTLSAPDLDSQLKTRIDSNYSANFKTYFPEIIPEIKTQECPTYCWDGSNSTSYCTQTECNSWHDGLMLDSACTGLCDGGTEGGCSALDCASDCASTYCNLSGNDCCPEVGTAGADSCTTESSCISQYSQHWCDNSTSRCCGSCTANDGSCCASYYTYNLVDASALASQCYSSGNGYCDTCCDSGDCSDFYEDISTQFASVQIPILLKTTGAGTPQNPIPEYFGFVADEKGFLDDVLNFDSLSQGDQIIGWRYDDDNNRIAGPPAVATVSFCPAGATVSETSPQGQACGTGSYTCVNDENIGPNGEYRWMITGICNNPTTLKELIPGRGYVILTNNSGNLSFINPD